MINILNTSVEQLNHLMGAAHQTHSPDPLGPDAAMLAEQAPPAGAPNTIDLHGIFDNMAKAPGATSIVHMPPLANAPVHEVLFNQVQTIDSSVSHITALCLYGERPDGYDITNPRQASALVKASANWRYGVFISDAAETFVQCLKDVTGTTRDIAIATTFADLPRQLVSQLFGTFELSDEERKELDSILEGIVSKLSALGLSFGPQSQTLDHLVSYFHVDQRTTTVGDQVSSDDLRLGVLLFYLHIDQASWITAMNSAGEPFTFKMNYTSLGMTLPPYVVPHALMDLSLITRTMQFYIEHELPLMRQGPFHGIPSGWLMRVLNRKPI